MIEVVRPGIASTFQDLGRPGLARVGVGSAGAIDRGLAALVNRLVGNGPEAVVIETCGEIELSASVPVVVATSDDLAPVTLREGDRTKTRPGAHGRVWHYVAVRGGFAADTVLGSASYDSLAALGPPPLFAGQRLHALPASGPFTVVDHAPLRELGTTVRILPGPRRDWFSDGSWSGLTAAPWTVTTTSRIGARLTGATIQRVVERELPSEGLVRGAIQIPPSGELVVMLADHPTTGGYPVIAVVHPDDVAIVAQHAAGSAVRFRRHG